MRVRKEAKRWEGATHVVTLTVVLHNDGTYVASLASMRPGSAQREMHYLDGGLQEYELAPPAFAALTSAAKQALDAYWAGELG